MQAINLNNWKPHARTADTDTPTATVADTDTYIYMYIYLNVDRVKRETHK